MQETKVENWLNHHLNGGKRVEDRLVRVLSHLVAVKKSHNIGFCVRGIVREITLH